MSPTEKVLQIVPEKTRAARLPKKQHRGLDGARFSLGQTVRDLHQAGKLVSIGAIIYNDDPSYRDYHYRLGYSPIVRRERDLEETSESSPDETEGGQ